MLSKPFRLAFLVVCLLPLISVSGQAPADDVAARIARVEKGIVPSPGTFLKGTEPERRTVFERMKDYRVPGVSIAVINDGRIEWARGYGVLEEGGSSPVTPETLFQAASISKSVAAAAALHLVRRGVLSLDEDVNLKLKSWRVPDNNWTVARKVTLRGLLSHTAGLTVHGFPGYEPGTPVPTLRQVLDGEKPANTAPIRVDIEIGSQFRYAGGGYTVMQQLLIDVLDKPFPQIMRETVLDLAGMRDSTYEQPLPKELESRAARGHRMNKSVVRGDWHIYPEMAAAGLWTTPSDLCRFAIEIMSAAAGKSERILDEGIVRDMLKPQKGSYGLGLSIDGTGEALSFGHGGSNEGYKCIFEAFPKLGKGAAVMTNGDWGNELMVEILRGIALEYGWPSFRPREVEAARLEAADLDALTGVYEFTPVDRVTVTRDGDRLMVDSIHVVPTGKERVAFYPNTAGSFFSLKTSQTIAFVTDASGKAATLIIRQGPRERKAKRILT